MNFFKYLFSTTKRATQSQSKQEFKDSVTIKEIKKDQDYSYEYVLNTVAMAFYEKNEIIKANICVAIVGLRRNCLNRLMEIILDKSLDPDLRRFALRIASGYRDNELISFIKANCVANFAEILQAYNTKGDDESTAKMGLYTLGNDILNTPKFFEKFVSNDADGSKKDFFTSIEKVQPDSASIKIGVQEWMTSNLNVSKFRNGDLIIEAKTQKEWKKAGKNKQPAWCYYDNIPLNGNKYGKLYNWYAVIDNRNIAPVDWHIPTNSDWDTLENYLISNGYNYDGTKTDNKIAKSLASNSDWDIDDDKDDKDDKEKEKGYIGNDLTKNNKSGFNAMPCGERTTDGYFFGKGEKTGWWITIEENSSVAWLSAISNKYSSDLKRKQEVKVCGYSVRCIRDTIANSQ